MYRYYLKQAIRSADFGIGKIAAITGGLGLLGGAGYLGYRGLRKHLKPKPEITYTNSTINPAVINPGIINPRTYEALSNINNNLITDQATKLLGNTQALAGIAASGFDDLVSLGTIANTKIKNKLQEYNDLIHNQFNLR